MNDLLFYTLILALLYYFFFYLPQQKEITNPLLTKPLTHSQFTQTDPTTTATTEYEPGAVNLPGPEYQEYEPELESTLDTLLKDIQDLNKSLK
jgi:energy-converting hydrogenase Eha subunit F